MSASSNAVSSSRDAGRVASDSGDRLNVLVVVLDDIGLEWFSFYGIGRRFTTDPNFAYARTPHLQALVDSGLLFTNGHSNPICGPTRSNIQTGLYAFRTGFGENIRDPSSGGVIGARLSDDFVWLPEALHSGLPGAYETAAIGKWHLCDGYTSSVSLPPPPPNANLDHAVANGYDFSAIHIPNYGGTYSWYRVVNGGVVPSTGFVAPPFDTSNWAPSVHAADALNWIRTRHKPWFMYLAFNAPHSPFTVPPIETLSPQTKGELAAAGLVPGFTQPRLAGYEQVKLTFRASMESIDTCIGLVLDGLTPAVRARTMVIVIGDNGTVANALPPGFLHAKRDVFGGGTRVPLIVNGPVVADPGRTTDALAHAVDIYATVVALAKARLPVTNVEFDSVSLLPVLRNTGAPRTRVFAEAFGPWGQTNPTLLVNPQRSLFDGRWRYISQPNSTGLYDNLEDPLEATNVIAEHPEIAERLARELDDLLGS